MEGSNQIDSATNKREEGKRLKAGTEHTISQQNQKIGGDIKFTKNPEFLKERSQYFDELYARQQEEYKQFPQQEITIILPDGSEKKGTAFVTTPLDIAKSIANSLAEKVMVARVRYTDRIGTLDQGLLDPEAEKEGEAGGNEKGQLWDANRPLEGSCHLNLFTFSDEDGKHTFWHSSAHVLGESMERDFGVHLCHGPPTESGFFYDAYTGSDIFQQAQYAQIETAAKKIVSEKQVFQRLILSKDEALKLFSYNPFKLQLIKSKIPDGGRMTAYKCGDLIDLCTGPHIPSTGRIKAFKVMKNSSAYWLGKDSNDSLQRIYGVTFPSKKELDEYIHLLEEAERRDHRNIGKQQHLFNINYLSPGCVFFYPYGTKIYNKLIDFMRKEYRVRGYSEVISPNVYNLKLWKTSGHYKNYKKNIFIFDIEKQGFGVKPMNCPGHCLMFDSTSRSYRELPLRLADFGVLHRNEISGALSGLTRVRRFQQDDAHIFCAPEQLMSEVLNCLDFLDYVYGIFGFHFELELSTRPEERLGEESLWDMAEAGLTEALNIYGKPWKLNPGDGAFYGPKIDIKVFDALKRPHQCGTIQLDFQLPIRFNLQYKTDEAVSESGLSSHQSDGSQRSKKQKKQNRKEGSEEVKKEGEQQQEEIQQEHKNQDESKQISETSSQKKEGNYEIYPPDEHDSEPFRWEEHPVKPGHSRPVIVHRAILGSVERFTAILIEHLAGKWPFWLSPKQAILCPVSEHFVSYCDSVYLYLLEAGFEVDVDRTNATLNKKVRNSQLAQWNYILVCGEEEVKSGTVDIRSREGDRVGKKRVDELVDYFNAMYPSKSKKYEELFSKKWNPNDYPVVPQGDNNEEQKSEKKEEVK